MRCMVITVGSGLLCFVVGWIVGYVRTSRFYVRITRPVYGDDPTQPF